MRTTLTLEDDVAARLEQLRRAQERPFKEIVNDLLRAGLDTIGRPHPGSRDRYETPSVSLGGCLVGSIDNVQEALSVVEGENRR